jgi:hypothetical protein
MKKLLIILAGSIALVASIWIIGGSEKLANDNTVLEESVATDMQRHQTKPIMPDSVVSNSTTQKNANLSNSTGYRVEQSQKANQRELMDYSDDWCNYGQLSERDQSYAQAELDDWEASVGRFAYNVYKEFGYQGYDNSYVSEPYLEISKDSLLTYIDEEDPMAMFAALDRDDFEMQEAFKVAQQLLILGYTGKAIQSLVIHEMVLAGVKYDSNSGKITDTVRKHLEQAMTYATYSLKNYDAIGLIQIIDDVETDEKFKSHLNPALIFSERELETIASNAEELSEWIRSERNKKGLPALNRELSKIAKHELDRDIGMLYGREPVTMKILNEHFGSHLPQLATNDCRAKHSELFARLN